MASKALITSDEFGDVSRQFGYYAAQLREIAARMDHRLLEVTWEGPSRESFMARWSQHKGSLLKLSMELEETSCELLRRAESAAQIDRQWR